MHGLEVPDKKMIFLASSKEYPMSQTAQTQTPAPDFQAARKAMVNSQLNPSGIVTEEVLEAYLTVPREAFVPAERQGVCYLDDDINFANGRSLIEPLAHALMVENAAIKPTDTVLDIGGYTGYSAAILAKLAGKVIALDSDAQALNAAKSSWAALKISSIEISNAPHAGGCAGKAPFDVIVINGAVGNVPRALFDQLAQGGRLVCAECPSGQKTGQIKVYTKQGAAVSARVIADTAVPYLQGFEPVATFTF